MNKNIVLIRYIYDNIKVDTDNIKDLKAFYTCGCEIINSIIEYSEDSDIMSEYSFIKEYEYYNRSIYCLYKDKEDLIKFYKEVANI